MNSLDLCRSFVLGLLIFWSFLGHTACDLPLISSLREGLIAAKRSNCQRADLQAADNLVKAIQKGADCDPAVIMRLKRSLQSAKVATTLNESGEPCRTHIDSALDSLASLTPDEGL